MPILATCRSWHHFAARSMLPILVSHTRRARDCHPPPPDVASPTFSARARPGDSYGEGTEMETRRQPHGHWPASEAEAVEREWRGFPLSSLRPSAKLQTYARPTMRGLGVRVAPQAKALLVPKQRKARLLWWFDGDMFEGEGAERRAARALNDAAPETIMVNEHMFLAPRRGSAALVECAASAEAANCELSVTLRRDGVQWPALLQRRDIAAG